MSRLVAPALGARGPARGRGADRRRARRVPARLGARARLDDRAALDRADVPDLQDAARPVELAAGQPDPARARAPAAPRARVAARPSARSTAEYGSEVLADTPRSGFGALAWLAPTVLVLAGGGLAVRARAPLARRRCSRRRARRSRSATGSSGNSTTSSRGSSELRRRSQPRSARACSRSRRRACCRSCPPTSRPCGGASVDDLRERRGLGQTLRGVAPFVLGFGAVFVVFGALVGAAGLGARRLARARSRRPRGSSSSPWVWRSTGVAAAAVAARADRRSRAAALGARCSAARSRSAGRRASGPVLAAVLALASARGGRRQAALLLGAYAAGLALPLIATAVAFDRALGAASFLRDRYASSASSRASCWSSLGLLVFFDRIWWLSVAVNRVLRALGLDALHDSHGVAATLRSDGGHPRPRRRPDDVQPRRDPARAARAQRAARAARVSTGAAPDVCICDVERVEPVQRGRRSAPREAARIRLARAAGGAARPHAAPASTASSRALRSPTGVAALVDDLMI